jgi:hypothetical protein
VLDLSRNMTEDMALKLGRVISTHILTADTFGSVQKEMTGIPREVVVIGKENRPAPRQTMSGT